MIHDKNIVLTNTEKRISFLTRIWVGLQSLVLIQHLLLLLDYKGTVVYCVYFILLNKFLPSYSQIFSTLGPNSSEVDSDPLPHLLSLRVVSVQAELECGCLVT